MPGDGLQTSVTIEASTKKEADEKACHHIFAVLVTRDASRVVFQQSQWTQAKEAIIAQVNEILGTSHQPLAVSVPIRQRAGLDYETPLVGREAAREQQIFDLLHRCCEEQPICNPAKFVSRVHKCRPYELLNVLLPPRGLRPFLERHSDVFEVRPFGEKGFTFTLRDKARVAQALPGGTTCSAPCAASTSDMAERSAPASGSASGDALGGSSTERIPPCIALGIHTNRITDYSNDPHFTQRGGNSDSDDDIFRLLQRLASLNTPLGNLNVRGRNPLQDQLVQARRLGFLFTFDWHHGGKTNANACTTILCQHCGARATASHPYHPVKLASSPDGLADPEVLDTANAVLVRFLFDEERIEAEQLLRIVRCTVERHQPGTVVRSHSTGQFGTTAWNPNLPWPLPSSMAQALPGRTVCSGVAGGMARAASTSNMAERSAPASGNASGDALGESPGYKNLKGAFVEATALYMPEATGYVRLECGDRLQLLSGHCDPGADDNVFMHYVYGRVVKRSKEGTSGDEIDGWFPFDLVRLL